MEPTPPEPEYPFYGRAELDHAHAPYVIVRSLMRLGLADWSATLLHWLARYDGLEMHLHAACDPACEVRDVLARHVSRWAETVATGTTCIPAKEHRARREAIVEDLLELDFVRARAHWGPLMVKRIVWKPLEQDWMWFLQLGPHWEVLKTTDSEELDVIQVWSRSMDDAAYMEAIRQMLLQVDEPTGNAAADPPKSEGPHG